MTVPTSTSRNDYVGNGSTTTFAYTFKILSNTNLSVIVDGTTRILTTDYTVTGVGVDGGGNVVFVSPPASAAKITVVRNQPLSQLSDYQPNEEHPSGRIETDYDKLVMLVQQVNELITRAIQVGINVVVPSSFDPKLPTIVGSKVLAIKADGSGFELLGMPVTPAGSSFNDAEGDPTSVGDTAGSDGSSAYSARRDHRHQHTIIASGDHHTEYLKKTGGTMTGAVVLPGNPTAALEAAPKQYVDAAVGAADEVRFIVQGNAVVGTKLQQGLISIARTIARVRIYSDTAPVGSDLIIDINKNGVTIWTTQANRAKVVAGANAGTTTTFDVTAVAAGDRLSVDVDQVGSGTPGGNDLLVTIEFA